MFARLVLSGLLIAGYVLASPAVSAADEKPKYVPWFSERFFLAGGGWFQFPNTTIGARNTLTDTRTSIDLEDDLGLDDFVVTPWVRGEFRFFNRNRILVEYSGGERDAVGVLDDDLDLDGDGNTIPAGSSVRAKLKLQYIRTAYAFSFIKTRKFEVAINAGVHFLDFSLDFDAVAANQDEGLSESTDFSGPLPNVGMEGGWAINDRFALFGGFSWLQVSIDGVSGGIWAGGLGLQMHVIRNFDVGLRYQFLSLNADRKRNDVRVAIDTLGHGPLLYGAVRF